MIELRIYAAAASAPVFVFGHGAGAGHDHPWITRVARGLCDRGITVATFNFPYISNGRRAPDRPDVLEAAFASAWAEASSASTGPRFGGGKSMGGRMASQAAARGLLDPPPRGLVFFGYPLHPPSKPTQRRDAHLPRVGAPMLFLSGTRDPFASPDELQALAATMPNATVRLTDGGDHSLTKRSDREGRGLDEAIDAAAAWIRAHAG